MNYDADWNLLREVNLSNHETTDYVYANGYQIARRDPAGSAVMTLDHVEVQL